MMDRVVLSELLPGTVVMFELVPLAVAIFLLIWQFHLRQIEIVDCALPLAVAIFVLIWRLHLPQIAIVVQVVEIVTPFHR